MKNFFSVLLYNFQEFFSYKEGKIKWQKISLSL
jgi:hypothetical protein